VVLIESQIVGGRVAACRRISPDDNPRPVPTLAARDRRDKSLNVVVFLR